MNKKIILSLFVLIVILLVVSTFKDNLKNIFNRDSSLGAVGIIVNQAPMCGIKKNTCTSGSASSLKKGIKPFTLKVPQDSEHPWTLITQKWEKYTWEWKCTQPAIGTVKKKVVSCSADRAVVNDDMNTDIKSCLLGLLINNGVNITNSICKTNCDYPLKIIPEEESLFTKKCPIIQAGLTFRWRF